jgi:hypothetical protein
MLPKLKIKKILAILIYESLLMIPASKEIDFLLFRSIFKLRISYSAKIEF